MKNLHPGSIWSLGIAFGLILLSYGVFHHYLPKNEEASARAENAEKLMAEAKKLPQSYKKIETLNKQVVELENRWRAYVAEKTPPADVSRGGISLNVNAWQLAQDTLRFRNNVQRAVNKQALAGGVKFISGDLTVPTIDKNAPANSLLASYYNYPAYAFPVVIYDFGQIEVEGTYEQILENVKAWSRMPRYLAVADGLAISGTALRPGGKLRGTYNLSILGYIRNTGIFPPVPEGAAQAASGGTGGFGGPSGGSFGGPGAAGAPSSFGRPGAPGGGSRPGPVGAAGAGR